MKFFTDNASKILVVALILIISFFYNGGDSSAGIFFINSFAWFMVGLWQGYKKDHESTNEQ